MTKQVYAVPLAHPAAILRGQWSLDPCQSEYLRRVRSILDGTWTPIDVDELPATANPFPTLADLQAWYDNLTRDDEGFADASFDIECAGDFIRAIGFCDIHTLEYVCVHFRTEGGDVYQPEWLRERAIWTADLLCDPTVRLYPHNGISFDDAVLRRNGFVITLLADDTMLRAHYLYPEQPKGLQWLAILWNGTPGWKRLVAVDEEGEGK